MLITGCVLCLCLGSTIGIHGTHAQSREGSSQNEEPLIYVEEPASGFATVLLGQNLTMKCATPNLPSEAIVYWELRQKEMRVIITSVMQPVPPDLWKYSVFSDDSEHTLTIRKLSTNDSGLYVCTTYHDRRTYEGEIHVNVNGPPRVVIYQKEVEAVVGERALLSCHFTPPIELYYLGQLYWKFGNTNLLNLTAMSRYRYNMRQFKDWRDLQLIITDLRMTDTGNYTCVIKNAYGTAQGSVYLKVNKRSDMLPSEMPTESKSWLRTEPSTNSVYTEMHQELRITCVARGYRNISSMTWYLFQESGGLITVSSEEEMEFYMGRIVTYKATNVSGVFFSLVASNVMYNNTGTCVCEITDKYNKSSHDYVNVTVIGVPFVKAKQTTMNGTMGSMLKLTCYVWAYPEPTLFYWYLEERHLSTSSRITTTMTKYNRIEHEMSLTINGVTMDDFGVYTCKAFNPRGQAMAVQVVQDIDECSYDPPCNQDCTNTLGSFVCECTNGFQFKEGSKYICEDVDECNLPGKRACEHFCNNTDGSFLCYCRENYYLNNDGYSCSFYGPDDPEDLSDQNEIIYTVVGSCSGALLVIVLLIFAIAWCRRKKCDTPEESSMKSVFRNNVAYESSDERPLKLNSYASSIHHYQDEFPRQRLQLGIDLGQGRFGKVMMARALNISGGGNWEMVAVKTCNDSATDQEKQDLHQELQIMRKLSQHKNVVAYLGCCLKQDPLYIIMEYVPGGNLQCYLRKHRPSQIGMSSEELSPLAVKDLCMFALHVSRAMEHITSIGIIHRDIAARNVLVGVNRVCKICDFGLARDVEGSDVYERMSKGPSPIRWMAPESLADQCFTRKSDVWSYGVLLWEIVTLGATPYPGMTPKEVVQDVLMGKWLHKPLHCKQEIYTIMASCWDMEPKDRPNFTEIARQLERLLEKEADYIQFSVYQEAVYGVLDPERFDERV